MGRKKLEDPRNFGYRLRLNSREETMLDYICKETGLSKAKLFRKFLNETYESINPLNSLISKGE